ncbi:glycosyltransferase [Streptacidiphilus cavernicola]|uniref:Glycosyltransferase n=1 Tax=Streptacidiphilus cavernicola TaxID=3342716 RepID=A0ABV6VSF2_9ACTN
MKNRSERRPRVLYLAFYFPPSRASGVYRARATANHLAGQGWDVTVCAAPLDFLHHVVGSVDESLVETVDPRIRVERPRLNTYSWQEDLRDFSPLRRRFPFLARSLYRFGQGRVFPERYLSWARSTVRRALRMHARKRFDVVVATGNPFASFAAAWVFHKLTGVPFVMDYRDSWTLDIFHDVPLFPDGHIAWAWERRTLADASASVFVNNALRAWHAEHYPDVADRMMVVPNGWDADVLLDARAQAVADREALEQGERPLRFAYLGTLTVKQPVEEMAEAFRIARSHPDLADAELQLHGHLGFFKNSPRVLLERLGLDGADTEAAVRETGLRYCGPVAKTDVARVYEDADVLVFVAGGGRYVTSGKIFEYMASGHPIVSVHAEGIAAEEVLEGYPLWFNAEGLDVEALAASMIAAGKAARDLTREQRAEARRHADEYARDAVLVPFEQRLREIAGRPRVGAAEE